MKKKIAISILGIFLTSAIYCTDYYVSTSGNDTNSGAFDKPFRTLQKAIVTINAGDYIYMFGGTYDEAATINIAYGNNGTTTDYKHIYACSSDSVILNFSSMAELSTNRGIQVYGDYWYIKDIVIQDAGDNGMMISGNHNTIENCVFRRNHDSGLQISRRQSSLSSISGWPSYNMILHCEAYDNSDSDHEDADGFAPKLTCGVGNIFIGCVSHHNIDDGYDLYTKTETGPIGTVTFINCVAHDNGTLRDGRTSGNGDKNGFKLGGDKIPVNHIVRRCVAYNNGKHGFTYNSNPGTIEMSNCTSYQNMERNFSFDTGSSVFTNNLSYLATLNDKAYGVDNGKNVWDNDKDPLYIITGSDFVSLTPGPNADPFSNGFLQLKEGGQLIDKGVIIPEISYNGTAPDIGALEFGGNDSTPVYILSVSVMGNIGGTITISPEQNTYDSGAVVTVSATPAEGYTFAGWTGDYSGTDSIVEITMTAVTAITAVFEEIPVVIPIMSVQSDIPFIIYPNPMTSESVIEYTAIATGTVVIFLCDLTGSKQELFNGQVQSGEHRSINLDASVYIPGIYLVEVRENDRRVVQKVVLK